MSDNSKYSSSLSRRDFLKDAGLLASGVAASSLGIAAAGCSPKPTVKEVYVCPICGQEFAKVDLIQTHFLEAHPQAETMSPDSLTTLNINGVDYLLQMQPYWTLAFVLRDRLGLFGTKIGCDMGSCGSCTVLADGIAVLSCLMLAIESSGKQIRTIEGLSDGINLNPLQQKFYDNEAFQCGFCTPGFIMAGQSLLATNSHPSPDDVREAISGHICVCGNFKKVVEAISSKVQTPYIENAQSDSND